MYDIVIVGAGGFGREVYLWAKDSFSEEQYKIKGFLDDNSKALDDYNVDIGVIGSIDKYEIKEKDRFIIGIGTLEIKKQIVESLVHKGANFYTLIHPSAVIGTNVRIGKGCIICPNCILTNDITIGDFVFINASSTIGHDTIIGEYTSVNGKVEITGNVEVGVGCLFGVGAKVIPKRRIGDGATIGAGSVVIKNVPSSVTVFGNPAKSIWVSRFRRKGQP